MVTVQPVRNAYTLPKAKGMVSVSVRPSSMEPVHTGNKMRGVIKWKPVLGVAKAKRAKGAK